MFRGVEIIIQPEEQTSAQRSQSALTIGYYTIVHKGLEETFPWMAMLSVQFTPDLGLI
jgi:hypothetical protein